MAETIVGLVVVGAVLVAFMAYLRLQAASPPPIPIDADDSEMIAARETAQSTLDEFRSLYALNPVTSSVKVPITSSQGVLEWMVGNVLELTDVYVKVQLRGRPTTHRGAFQELQTFPILKIADWHVSLPNGKYRGGYTQRVLYDRMRAKGTLVGRAAEEAAKYE